MAVDAASSSRAAATPRHPDFLFLCEEAIVRPDDYCDYQLVSCYEKCESLGDREIDILSGFSKAGLHTRRMVLHVFERFRLPHVVDLATTLWQTDDCEFAKLSCLDALRRCPTRGTSSMPIFRNTENTFDVGAEDYRQSHMRNSPRCAAGGDLHHGSPGAT